MSRPLRVYVSATLDLEAEREVVGEALARFPVSLPWLIRRTPHPGEQRPEALDEVHESDFFLILLGQDISAPVGAEVEAALTAAVPLLALEKDVPNTPAGRFFRYNSVEKWERFKAPADLQPTVVRFLAAALVEHAFQYGLGLAEATALAEHLRGKGQPEDAAVTGKGPAGAGESAVIVSGRRR